MPLQQLWNTLRRWPSLLRKVCFAVSPHAINVYIAHSSAARPHAQQQHAPSRAARTLPPPPAKLQAEYARTWIWDTGCSSSQMGHSDWSSSAEPLLVPMVAHGLPLSTLLEQTKSCVGHSSFARHPQARACQDHLPRSGLAQLGVVVWTPERYATEAARISNLTTHSLIRSPRARRQGLKRLHTSAADC